MAILAECPCCHKKQTRKNNKVCSCGEDLDRAKRSKKVKYWIDNHVFLYNGKPITDIGRSFQTACKEAGILYGRKVRGGFTFHDLRHTFNTNMRKAGVAESVIMKITGHSTREMFDRYNTIDIEDAQKASSQLQNYLNNSDQTETKADFL